MKLRHWTKNDECYLKNKSKDKTVSELASHLDRTETAVWHKLIKLSLHPKSKNKKYYNTDFFKKWSDDMAYVLGYWFADGCICSLKNRTYKGYDFQISSNDFEILQKIKTAISSEHKIIKHDSLDKRNGKISHGYIFKLNGEDIYNDILYLGGTERKSLTAKFPHVPKKYLRHFIRGFFDGDGCIHINRTNCPQISFSGTKIFLQVLMTHLPHKMKINKHPGVYSIQCSGNHAQDILKFMYDDSKLYLDRKYKKYLECMTWINKQNPTKWKNNELKLLISKYPTIGTKLHKKLKNRDEHAIRHKASELGLKYSGDRYWKQKFWTEKEMNVLRKEYANNGPNVHKLLKHHSVNAIITKACILRRTENIPLHYPKV